MNLELDLKRSFADPKNRHFSINDTNVSYEGKIFSLKEITAIKYGTLVMSVNGIRSNKFYEFQFQRQTGEKIRITFSSAGFRDNKELEEKYNQILTAVLPITKRLANEYLSDLDKDKPVVLKNLEIKKDGLYITKRPITNFFRKKTFHLKWDEAEYVIVNGNFVLRSKNKHSISCSLNFLRTWNSDVIRCLIVYLFENGRCFHLNDKKFEIA